MSVFGNYAPAEVIDAAEKSISKMDEADVAAAIGQSERTMNAANRALLVEAIFDAFRARGESSQDAAEAAGTTVDAIGTANSQAVHALMDYARANPGLLKEAAIVLIEQHPEIAGELAPSLSGAIAARLRER
jgi:hypothetical protein